MRFSIVPAGCAGSEVAPVEDVQGTGEAAGGLEEDALGQLIAQGDRIGRLEYPDAIAKGQFIGQSATGDDAGIRTAPFGVELEVLNAQPLSDSARRASLWLRADR